MDDAVRVQNSRQQVGALGEDLAVAELKRQGLEVLARNWRCPIGELDVVAVEDVGGRRTLVFCEVKTRTGLGFGSPLESITTAKLRRLRYLAAQWLVTEGTHADAIRIDAVGVVMLRDEPPRLTHVRGIG